MSVKVGSDDFLVAIDKMAAIQLGANKQAVASMHEREWDIRRALDLIFDGV